MALNAWQDETCCAGRYRHAECAAFVRFNAILGDDVESRIHLYPSSQWGLYGDITGLPENAMTRSTLRLAATAGRRAW